MATIDEFGQFFANNPADISLVSITISLILGAILAFILSRVYARYGRSLSDKKGFSSNFVLLTTTTTLIIMVVKSSLALSLGLVGALSIVRFRSAIKEPEELAFLFLCIAIGLGLGAGQTLITTVSFFIILVFVFIRSKMQGKEEHQNLNVIISGKGIRLKKIIEILNKRCDSVNLKRFDQNQDITEASFLIDISSYENLEEIKKELEAVSKNVSVTYLDKIGFY